MVINWRLTRIFLAHRARVTDKIHGKRSLHIAISMDCLSTIIILHEVRRIGNIDQMLYGADRKWDAVLDLAISMGTWVLLRIERLLYRNDLTNPQITTETKHHVYG